MTKFLVSGVALAALVAIAPASAQPVQAPVVQRPPAAQVHTRAQVGAHVAAMFQRLDTNRDGFITRAESDAAKAQRGARKMHRAANRSPEKLAARRGAAFERLDANRDGAISRDEFARAPALRHQRMAAGGVEQRRHRSPGAAMRRMHHMGGMDMGALRGAMFEMADANRDARVSLQEATAAAYRHFDMADANRDGQVTREERMQVRQNMRLQRRPG